MEMVWRETAGLLKSISKLKEKPAPGTSETQRLPSSTETGCTIRMTRRGRDCSTTSALSIKDTNGAALPSMIGTSGPSISIRALSMAHPERAAIRCSTVPTVTPSELPTVVHMVVSTT